jgi:transcriptional regulator with XRE-family HTH domain
MQAKTIQVPVLKTLGARLRALRVARHMTQKELAEEMAVTRAAVSFWESDTTEPSHENLQAIMKLFAPVEYSWLMKGLGPAPFLPKTEPRRRQLPGAESVRQLTMASVNAIKELIVSQLPKGVELPHEWHVPPLSERVSDAAVFRVVDDIDPIRTGDYAFIDLSQQEIQSQGMWLVEMADVGKVLVRARIVNEEDRPQIKIASGGVEFNLKTVKNAIGRVVAYFTFAV